MPDLLVLLTWRESLCRCCWWHWPAIGATPEDVRRCPVAGILLWAVEAPKSDFNGKLCACRYPLIGELSLYDIVGTEGVGADISHMDTSTKVR
jgi:hypothetical protein